MSQSRKVARYIIRADENYGGRRTLGRDYASRAEAEAKLKKILSPPKKRVLPDGRVIYLTSYRNAQSGTGIINPRVKKIMVMR